MEVLEMEDGFDVVTIIVAIVVASYAAIMLNFVVQREFGWSLVQVREWATLAALVLSAMTFASMLGARSSRPRRRD
jgi:hypothetical protein